MLETSQLLFLFDTDYLINKYELNIISHFIIIDDSKCYNLE